MRQHRKPTPGHGKFCWMALIWPLFLIVNSSGHRKHRLSFPAPIFPYSLSASTVNKTLVSIYFPKFISLFYLFTLTPASEITKYNSVSSKAVDSSWKLAVIVYDGRFEWYLLMKWGYTPSQHRAWGTSISPVLVHDRCWFWVFVCYAFLLPLSGVKGRSFLSNWPLLLFSGSLLFKSPYWL